MILPFTCKSCGYRRQDNVCVLDGRPVNPEESYCDMHCRHPYTCDLCGNLLSPGVKGELTPLPDGTYIRLCQACSEQYYMCSTCKNDQCNFNRLAQTSGIPPMVQQIVRQGPMQMITQVRNPELVKQACTNCPCFKNGKCQQEAHGTCSKWELRVPS